MLCQHSYSHAHILFECICWFDNFLLTLLLNGNYFHLTNGKGLCEVTTSIHLSACVCGLLGGSKIFRVWDFRYNWMGFACLFSSIFPHVAGWMLPLLLYIVERIALETHMYNVQCTCISKCHTEKTTASKNSTHKVTLAITINETPEW